MYIKYKIKKILKLSFILLSTLVFLFSICIYFTRRVEPAIVSRADAKARAVAFSTSSKVINDYFKNIDSREFISLIIEDNKVISVKTDTTKLNKISSDIANEIQQKFSNLGMQEISFTIGNLNGNKLLYNLGPTIKIKIKPSGTVSARFETKFESAGINQTIHKINLVIKTNVIVVAPFITKYQEHSHVLSIVETVLVGDVPETYYNITGVDDLEKKDALEVM